MNTFCIHTRILYNTFLLFLVLFLRNVHSKASIHSLEDIVGVIIWMNASKIPLKHIPCTKLLKLFVSYNLQLNE
jgi:hypothetical protein